MFLGDAKEAHVVPFFINGKDYHPERSFDVVSPLTGKVSYRCGAASVSDAAAAVNAAAAAFKTWRKTTPAYRRDVFLKAADLIQQKSGELADIMANETGATLPWALFNLKTAGELIRDAASRISAIEGSFPSLADPSSSGIVLREPYGVVLSIAPWYVFLPTTHHPMQNSQGQCAIGAFLHGGQICMSTEKIIVHSKVRPQFQEKLVAAVNEIFPPDGPAPVLINEAAVQRNRALVADAAAKGAAVILGDVHATESRAAELRPVVVGDVTPAMDMYATESFGPTVSLHEVETEAQALQLANDSEYGLTAAVFTEDLRRGLRFAREIDSGAVHINGMTVHDEPALPHGGTKSSGFGRFNAAIGLEEWVRTKTVTFKH
ncbi:ALDH-like protein [Trichoderma longibrachiatum ATCC 18648]|uniref:ALDH-like protein n=1 Tax=Trichoderma longibrachiatum ATCC 18648 TaxID=983965 RepID=A0A2T4BW46_TRILO|nr:ALDH-like protein [Trichoderma longibrachiatum ATCC 18648]